MVVCTGCLFVQLTHKRRVAAGDFRKTEHRHNVEHSLEQRNKHKHKHYAHHSACRRTTEFYADVLPTPLAEVVKEHHVTDCFADCGHNTQKHAHAEISAATIVFAENVTCKHRFRHAAEQQIKHLFAGECRVVLPVYKLIEAQHDYDEVCKKADLDRHNEGQHQRTQRKRNNVNAPLPQACKLHDKVTEHHCCKHRYGLTYPFHTFAVGKIHVQRQ